MKDNDVVPMAFDLTTKKCWIVHPFLSSIIIEIDKGIETGWRIKAKELKNGGVIDAENFFTGEQKKINAEICGNPFLRIVKQIH